MACSPKRSFLIFGNARTRSSGLRKSLTFYSGSIAWGLTLLMALNFLGCSLTRESTDTYRSPLEQLLLSQSLDRSFSELRIPLASNQTVFVETNGYSADREVVKTAFQNWLGRQGFLVKDKPQEARYSILLHIQSHGTETDSTFFGVPPIQGAFFPVALPELTFYGSVQQVGYSRLSVDLYQTENHQHLASLPLMEGQVFYTNYTLLFIFSWHNTDLNPPPPT